MLDTFIPFVSVEFVQFLGSFPVVGDDAETKMKFIQEKLQLFTEGGKSQRVLLVISLTGVKICSCDGEIVHMNHALHRISYATCEPDQNIFTFLARDPKAHFDLQNCHAFQTANPTQAEELNSIVGHAFRLAYSAHLEKSSADLAPSRDSSKRSRLRTGRLSSRPRKHKLKTNLDDTSSSSSQDRCESHFSYHSSKEDIVTESGCSSSQGCCDQSWNMRTPSHTSQPPKPTSLPGLRYSDNQNNLFLSPDSDTGNSPTDLNSAKHVTSKPALTKNVNLDPNITIEEFNRNTGSTTSSLSGSINCLNSSNSSDKVDNKRHIECKRAKSSNHGEPLKIDIAAFEKLVPPPLPERLDSLSVEDIPPLAYAPWFQAGIPREIALEVLSREPVGAFMVRESTSKPGCYALSLRVPRDFTVSGIAHYLIVNTSKGYKIKGFTKEFLNLTALITHHSVMPELLPCPLSLSRYQPSDTPQEPEEDPDYNTLSDFRKKMADLNV